MGIVLLLSASVFIKLVYGSSKEKKAQDGRFNYKNFYKENSKLVNTFAVLAALSIGCAFFMNMHGNSF